VILPSLTYSLSSDTAVTNPITSTSQTPVSKPREKNKNNEYDCITNSRHENVKECNVNFENKYAYQLRNHTPPYDWKHPQWM
jgi:hypothetical protein